MKYANLGIEDGEMSRVGGLESIYPDLIVVPEKFMDWEFVAFSISPIELIDGWTSLKPFTIAFINGWKILEKNRQKKQKKNDKNKMAEKNTKKNSRKQKKIKKKKNPKKK